MGMGNQQQIDFRQFTRAQSTSGQALRSQSANAKIRANSVEQSRIGEDADTKKIQQHRGVTKPGDGNGLIAPLRGIWLVRRRRDGLANLENACPKKSRCPGGG
jgi:hypothetical protein